MGLIQTSAEDYFIEPMAKRKKQPHLFYKRSSVLASLSQSSTFPRKCTPPPTHLQGCMSELLPLFILFCCCSHRLKIIAWVFPTGDEITQANRVICMLRAYNRRISLAPWGFLLVVCCSCTIDPWLRVRKDPQTFSFLAQNDKFPVIFSVDGLS